MLAGAFLVVSGCKAQHPSVITVEPDFDTGKISSILVLPVISSITRGEDPNRDSERITNRVLWNCISEKSEYKFLSPASFTMMVNKAKLGSKISGFNDKWATEHIADELFLKALATLNVDLILIPQIYLWAKDEADYRESGTASATQVGMTISLVDPVNGRVMWEATDENYKESVRTEGDRIQSTTMGIDRRIAGKSMLGRDVFAAPPYEDVVLLVVEALVGAVPEKVVFDR